jgi:hypothetical protein
LWLTFLVVLGWVHVVRIRRPGAVSSSSAVFLEAVGDGLPAGP